ncbi:acyltransferase family protein [Pseudomonas syringae]|uniref:acyltransferase family protein n=1 Tax=Pseudomonas syringae TaxID=317 RepID=UPI003F75C8CD
MQRYKVGYRPDIDGLRAIAVVSVILYHFKIGFISGGFVGVDIFFVISGYLISKAIIERRENASFDFSDFYLRRIRRLIPALLVTIAVSYVAAFWLFSVSDFKMMSGSVAFALAGLSNIFFWLESGYFDAASSSKPLLHTWSLGVEIQFYIIWPALLLILTKLMKRPVIAIVGLMVLGGVASVYFLNKDASGAFFLAPFRIHEFLLGGIVVFFERHRINTFFADISYVLGLVLVGLALFGFSGDSTLFPGVAVLLPTAGAALMILGGRHAIVALPFSTGLAVKLGKISYSLYLVHWPLFVFVSYVLVDQVDTMVKFCLLCGTLLLALGLYHFIEKPFRLQRESRLSGSRFSLLTVLASFAVIVPAACSWAQDGWSWRVPAEIREVARIDQASASKYVFALIKNLNQRSGFDVASGKEKILVIGDSQAGDLLNILNEQGAISGDDVVARLVDSACATPGLEKEKEEGFYTQVNPIVIKEPAYVRRCKDGLARAGDNVLISEADKIFIAFYWRDFAEPYYLDAINKIASETRAEVYVFGRKDLLKDSAFIASSLGRTAGLTYYAVRYKNPKTERINKSLALLSNVKYVDMMKATCPASNECVVLNSENKPAFFNATHLSKEGAKLYGPRVVQLVEEATKSL